MNRKLFTKVQFKGEKLLLQWEEIRNGHMDKKSLETRVEPHEDFFTAMRALDRPLCIEGELPETDDEYKRHDIQSVVCSYDEDGKGNLEMSASIISERFMEGTMESMKIATPLKPEAGEMSLDTLTSESIYHLLDEAQAYLDGKRHDLFSVEMTKEQKEAVGN